MKQILIFISLFLAIVCNINAQSITANQFNGRLQMTTVSNVSDSTWSITGYFTNSVNKYTTTQVAVNDKFFCQIGANTYVGRISVINSASDVTKLITFRVICNYPNPPNNIGAIIRTTSNGYPVFVDGLPNALQAGIQNYFATLVNTNAAGSPCEQTITQSTHGFRDFTPVRWNSNTSRYERSTHDTIVPDYIVVDSLTANTFKVANCGTYTTSLANGLYWFTSASPGYSLTADTTKVPLFQALNGKLILNPIVGFNLMSTGTDELADTAAAIRADFQNGIISALPLGDVDIDGATSSDLRIRDTRIQFDARMKIGADSSFIHDPVQDTTFYKGNIRQNGNILTQAGTNAGRVFPNIIYFKSDAAYSVAGTSYANPGTGQFNWYLLNDQRGYGEDGFGIKNENLHYPSGIGSYATLFTIRNNGNIELGYPYITRLVRSQGDTFAVQSNYNPLPSSAVSSPFLVVAKSPANWKVRLFNAYEMPTTAPSVINNAISSPMWTGTGSANTSSWLRSQHKTISGTTDGSGDITITFDAAMPDITYTMVATVEGTTSYTISAHTKATGTCKVRFFNPTTGAAVTATSVTISYEAKDY